MFSHVHALLAAEGQPRDLFRLGAAVALSLASPFAFAQGSALTLDQALQQATRRSASNQAGVSAIEASRESAAKADQLPDPMLKLGVDNLPVNGPDRLHLTRDFMTMRRVGIEQQWVSSDKRAARSERAQRAVELEEANHLANIAKVREETAKAWVAVWYAQRTNSLARMLESEANADLETQQATYRGARNGVLDATQAQLALVQIQDVRRKSEQELQTARAVLGRWMQAPVESVADALPALVSHVAKLPVEDLEKYHPMMLMAKRTVALADAETTVASKERRPDWSLEASYNQRGSQYSNMVSVGVSIPLTVNPGERQDRDIAEKSALATKARLQYEEALRELQNEIQTLSFTLSSLNDRVAALRQQLLPLANQQVELATAAYRSGTGSLSAVFNARRGVVEKQLQIAEMEKDAAMTWASLEYHVVPHNLPAPGRSVQ